MMQMSPCLLAIAPILVRFNQAYSDIRLDHSLLNEAHVSLVQKWYLHDGTTTYVNGNYLLCKLQEVLHYPTSDKVSLGTWPSPRALSSPVPTLVPGTVLKQT